MAVGFAAVLVVAGDPRAVAAPPQVNEAHRPTAARGFIAFFGKGTLAQLHSVNLQRSGEVNVCPGSGHDILAGGIRPKGDDYLHSKVHAAVV